MEIPPVFFGASLALLATSLGALGVFAFRRAGMKPYALALSFCAGVMLFTSIEMFSESHLLGGDAVAFTGLLIGFACIFLLEKLLPHAHLLLRKKELEHSKKKVALMAGTVTIHNIPEGFAIAASFASSTPLGWLVTLAIALQDIPEGLMVSLPSAFYGIAHRRSFLIGVFSGAVEFAAAIGGFFFLSIISGLTPIALSFSAGAMGYVTFFELLPDALKGEKVEKVALLFLLGAAVALGLPIFLSSI